MTPYDKAVNAGKELAESAQDILANLRHIRGDTFATAVAAAFEVRQLVDVLARIAHEGKENEYIVGLAGAGVDLGASIAAKTANTLTEAEIDEVIALADKLYDRRVRLMENIRKPD